MLPAVGGAWRARVQEGRRTHCLKSWLFEIDLTTSIKGCQCWVWKVRVGALCFVMTCSNYLWWTIFPAQFCSNFMSYDKQYFPPDLLFCFELLWVKCLVKWLTRVEWNRLAFWEKLVVQIILHRYFKKGKSTQMWNNVLRCKSETETGLAAASWLCRATTRRLWSCTTNQARRISHYCWR